jgi:hypothetical protein
MAFDLEAMLRALRDVEFILVGGVAAAAQGAPIITQDRALGRPKDLALLPVLEATLKERQNRGD